MSCTNRRGDAALRASLTGRMDDQLIGREREPAQLAGCVADALAGHGSLVLLAGEAGVGKTRPVDRVTQDR
jgi:Cdc6-like AAA superfamily ATPase